jgi:hypothetical protein
LNETNSKRLGKAIEKELADGCAQEWKDLHEADKARLPDEECRICGGTGKRLPPPNCGPGDLPCNGCDGHGKHRPHECEYTLDLEDLREFAEFLKACGGFAIW